MKESVYVEKTIASYLVSRPSGNVRVASNQEKTMDCWENSRQAWQTGKPVVVPAAELAATGFSDWQNWCILEIPFPGGGSLA